MLVNLCSNLIMFSAVKYNEQDFQVSCIPQSVIFSVSQSTLLIIPYTWCELVYILHFGCILSLLLCVQILLLLILVVLVAFAVLFCYKTD